MQRADRQKKESVSDAQAHSKAALMALARLLGAHAARERVAASCREEGGRDGA